jgi:hypothetical protein
MDHSHFQLPLDSNPGMSQPEMEKSGLDDLANGQAYVDFRKKAQL